MTAWLTFSPRWASAASLSLRRIIAEISGGAYCLPRISTRASPLPAFTTLYGTSLISWRTSSYRRPMKRLIEKTVFSGFVMAWRLAIWPTRISPSFAKPTTDGVSRLPSWLGMTVAVPPSMTATTEFVVPRSMPITLAMLCSCHWSCAASDRTRRGPSSRSAERDLDGHVELRVVGLHLVRSVLGPELFRDVTD